MATNNNEDFVIKVSADTADAEKKLDNVTKATQKVGNAAKSTGTQSQNLGKTLGGVAEAGSNVASAFGPAGSAIALAANAIRGLKAAMSGVAGGLTVVIGAIVGIFSTITNKIREHREEQEELQKKQIESAKAIEDQMKRLNQTRLDNLAKQYTDATSEAEKLLSITDRIAQAQKQWIAANLQLNLANLEQRRQEELGKVAGNTRDEEDVNAHFDEARQRLINESAMSVANKDLESAQQRMSTAETARDLKREQLTKTQADLEGAQEAVANSHWGLQVLHEEKMRGEVSDDRFKVRYTEYQSQIKANEELVAKLSALVPQLQMELQDLEAQVTAADRNLTSAQLNVETQQVTANTENLKLQNAGNARTQRRAREDAAAREQEQARLQREAEAKAQAEARRQERIDSAQEVYDREHGDVLQLQAEHQQVNSDYAAGQQRVDLWQRRLSDARHGSGGRTDADQIKAAARALGEARKELVALSNAAKAFNASYAKRLQKEEDDAAKALQRLNAARESK